MRFSEILGIILTIASILAIVALFYVGVFYGFASIVKSLFF